MKGIILAAGRGSRLYPMTRPVCKPLLPVYDKPLIYYPLTTLIRAGIRDILIIIPEDGQSAFQNLLGDGHRIGVHIEYQIQKVPRGIADALVIGADFIDDDGVALILGDNIFDAKRADGDPLSIQPPQEGATVFGYYVQDPRPFGVVSFDENGRAVSIEEKPQVPKSHYIIPGLYYYDRQVVDIAKHLRPSARGEYEITDVNREYLRRGQLKVVPLERGVTWLDAGTADDVLMAAQMVFALQRSGVYVGCIEEAAYEQGFINRDQLHFLGKAMEKTNYGKYLLGL